MRSILSLFVFTMLSLVALAQAPQGIPYQAVARNSSGVIIASTAISVRFTIHDSIATGTTVYRETFNPTTTAQGLFSVNVGMGTAVSGTFSGINWGHNSKFMQVEMDPAGGTSYIDMGTQQMMSVPYALYAGNANTAAILSSQVNKINVGFGGSSTWTCPVGVTQITVQLWGGAGGGGAGSTPTSASYGCPYLWPSCGYQYYGGTGGKGGNGGYNKQIISVVPGTVYNVKVGNAGLAGGNGSASDFNGIVSAPGGTGGAGGSSLIGSCLNGSNGIDGSITNYVISSITYYTQNASSPISYIPASYLTTGIFPSCCAIGGIAGGGGMGGCVGFGGAGSATNGQSGFCVISY